MTTQHTPGPWAILEQQNDNRTHISNGAHIVCTLGTTRTDGSPNHSANARLISSAPDLLSALVALLEQADLGEVDEETAPIVEAARAAIAKAEGLV